MTTFLFNIIIKKIKIINYLFIIFILLNFFIYFYNIDNLKNIQNYQESIFFNIMIFLMIVYFVIICIYYFYQYIFINSKKNLNKKKLNIMKGEEFLIVSLSTIPSSSKSYHFLKNHYFILEDLSFNIKSNIKWIRYNIKIAKSIVKILNDEDAIIECFDFDDNINLNETLQELSSLKNIQCQNHTIELFVNGDFYMIDDKFNVDVLIEKWDDSNSIENFFIYSENDFIEIKIKLNLIEFIILTSGNYYFNFNLNKKN